MECYEEDDHFYAELRKQILLLTAEEDDDVEVEVEVEELQQNKLKISAKSFQQRFNKNHATALQVQNGCYYNWSGDEETDSVPTWLFNLWKSGNGTGVFIPQITKSRTRYNPRRRNNAGGRMYKPVGAYTEAYGNQNTEELTLHLRPYSYTAIPAVKLVQEKSARLRQGKR